MRKRSLLHVFVLSLCVPTTLSGCTVSDLYEGGSGEYIDIKTGAVLSKKEIATGEAAYYDGLDGDWREKIVQTAPGEGDQTQTAARGFVRPQNNAFGQASSPFAAPAYNNVNTLPAIPRPSSGANVQVFSLDTPAQTAPPNAYGRPSRAPASPGALKLRPPMPNATSQDDPFVSEPHSFNFAPASVPSVPVAAVDKTVLFAHNQTRVKSKDKQKIKTIAKNVSDADTVAIEGHASRTSSIKDPVQRQITNLKVSMERAFNVAKVLMQNGIPADQVELKAYGEARPQSSEQKSRRVEIKPSSIR